MKIMVFEIIVIVFGVLISYCLYFDVKRYILCDNGFIEINGGNY